MNGVSEQFVVQDWVLMWAEPIFRLQEPFLVIVLKTYLLITYLNYHLSLIHTLPATRGMARRGHLGQEPDDGDQFEFVTGRWVSA